MIIKENYCSRNINRLISYFKVNQQCIDKSIIEQHLYCLGLLESFSKIGMNFVLSGDMAVYLMCENNLYLPNSLEIRVNKQDYLDDYLKEANQEFSALEYKKIKVASNYVIFEYLFSSFNNQHVKIYLNVKLEDHITTNVMSMAIDKPYLLNYERIYRVKTPSYEEVFAQALFDFKPNFLNGKVIDNGNFPLFIAKRLADMAVLYPYLEKFYLVIYYYEKAYDNYKNVYFNANYEYLMYDAYNSLINIYCQGKYRPEYYADLKKGLMEIQRYKINERLNINKINLITAYPLLACACVYQYIDCLSEIIKPHKKMNFYNYSKINMMKQSDIFAFNVVFRAIEIFDRLEVIEEA